MPTRYGRLLEEIDSIRERSSMPWIDDGCGVTRRDTAITALVHPDAYADESDRHRILALGGLTGSSDDAEALAFVLESYATSRRLRNRIALTAIPCANPDGLDLEIGPGNGSGGNPPQGYPPEGGFFNHETDPEARYLWRYIGFMAPDCILEIRASDTVRWEVSNAPADLTDALEALPIADEFGLLAAFGLGCPNDLGRIPGIRLNAPVTECAEQVARLWDILDSETAGVSKSEARRALQSRRDRTPDQLAAKLVNRYGDTLDPVIYTQGVAISGRLRYGALNDNQDEYSERIANLVESYLSGERPWFGDSDSGANYAGLVWCDEMYEASGDVRYRNLLLSTADKFRGNETGAPPPPCDPDYRTEDMFFAGALLGRAYALTKDISYLDIQTAFLLEANIQLDSGLFEHCRSVPYHWGRGNGFAALGYAETLTYLPEDHPDRDNLISTHKRHLDALKGQQRPSGMFSQLLDLHGTYQELTSVCMVGYAVARGLRLGWLDDSYLAFAESLWRSASERVGLDGEVVDGCTGTGAVNDRRFYIDRAAEYGQDDRTGNLALWFSVEMERLNRGI